jgi:hypothetical protein
MQKFENNIRLYVVPLPAQKKNKLIFKRPVKWTSEDGRSTETEDTILEIDVAPLQEQLVMQALSLFQVKTPKAKSK